MSTSASVRLLLLKTLLASSSTQPRFTYSACVWLFLALNMSLRGMRTNPQMNSLTELLGCGVRNTKSYLVSKELKLFILVVTQAKSGGDQRKHCYTSVALKKIDCNFVCFGVSLCVCRSLLFLFFLSKFGKLCHAEPKETLAKPRLFAHAY